MWCCHPPRSPHTTPTTHLAATAGLQTPHGRPHGSPQAAAQGMARERMPNTKLVLQPHDLCPTCAARFVTASMAVRATRLRYLQTMGRKSRSWVPHPPLSLCTKNTLRRCSRQGHGLGMHADVECQRRLSSRICSARVSEKAGSTRCNNRATFQRILHNPAAYLATFHAGAVQESAAT